MTAPIIPLNPFSPRAVQYQKNKGKCGVCGDNWADKQPRPHEAGGLYGNGIVAKRYVMGQVKDMSPFEG